VRLEFHPRGRAEFDQLADRHGDEFIDAAERSLHLILAHPEAAPRSPCAPPGWHVRQKLVGEGWPYLLIYTIRLQTLRIEAVAYTGRQPGYWRSRLADR
jgi:hypothetical protein